MTDQTKAADLVAIRERCDAATPGPWEAVSDRYKSAIRFGEDLREMVVETENHHYAKGFNQATGGFVRPWDAEFCAHAREDIPQLLDLLESQASRIRELEAALTLTPEKIAVAKDAIRALHGGAFYYEPLPVDAKGVPLNAAIRAVLLAAGFQEP